MSYMTFGKPKYHLSRQSPRRSQDEWVEPTTTIGLDDSYFEPDAEGTLRLQIARLPGICADQLKYGNRQLHRETWGLGICFNNLVDAQMVGQTVISLRQGDDDYENFVLAALFGLAAAAPTGTLDIRDRHFERITIGHAGYDAVHR
ncbi:hypothetical protein E8E11_005446 [Didymella keratinophila]|nr:hypothetical protein E8E11_005446 [Didymella keratinophila]